MDTWESLHVACLDFNQFLIWQEEVMENHNEEVSERFNSLEVEEQAMILTFAALSEKVEGFNPIEAMRQYRVIKSMLEDDLSEWES